MWRLIFLFLTFMNILTFIYPFLVKVDVRFNIIKLKGTVIIKIFNKFKFEFKVRIKNGYLYLNRKSKVIRQKISESNIGFLFILNLIKQLYFREQWLDFNFNSNFGFKQDSCVTAVGSGYIDVTMKSIMGKFKNNKKSSHILVNVKPQYNQDIFNIRVINTVRISVFDLFYVLFYSLVNLWRDNEKIRKRRTKKQ